MWMLGAFGSFEALFLLFFWAGRYKAIPHFAWFPVDVTLLFFVVSLVAATAVVAFRDIDAFKKAQDSGMVLFLLFLIWIIVSYLWSSRIEENQEKITYILTLLVWSFLGPFIIITSSVERVVRFIFLIMVFSFAMILYWFYITFILGIDIQNSASPIVGPNYLGYGENALCLFAGFIGLCLADKKMISVFMYITLSIFILFVMLFIGGKGPFLLALLAIPVTAAITIMKNSINFTIVKISHIFLSFCAILLLALLTVSFMNYDVIDKTFEQMATLERLFGDLGQSDFGDSASSRLDGQRIAAQYWLEAPIFGWGIGEYTVINGFLGYPHNLALEVLMELGLVGFLLFAGLIGLGLTRTWRIWPKDLSDWTIVMIGVLFIVMTFSRFTFQGYLSDERFMFVLLGLILGIGRDYRSLREGQRSPYADRTGF